MLYYYPRALRRNSMKTNGSIVFQSDFGLLDGAVSSMYGVAHSVSSNLRLYNLTHEIPQFNTWEASYRLIQTIKYWAPGTVFVSVVDPGVGTERRSVVALTNSRHYIVTPDNGTLTHVAQVLGIAECYEIEEETNRLKGSHYSYTFHGRDLYAYTGARLAAGNIAISEVGRKISPNKLVSHPHVPPAFSDSTIKASIDILDARYGSLWTSCPREMFSKIEVDYGEYVSVQISHHGRVVYGNDLKYVKSFNNVNIGVTLVYINSLLNVGVAINRGNFAKAYDVGAGQDWLISFKKGVEL